MISLIGRILRAFMPCFSLTVGFMFFWPQLVARADDEIFAVQSRASTPNFQQFLNLADDSTASITSTLFSPVGGIYGLTYLEGSIYAAELANGSSDEYLATIPHEGALIGQGNRVSSSAIGFANIESLAAADGILYGTSINFTAHRTTLIAIEPSSGIGSSIGVGDFDVIIVGLAFDPLADILYGAGIPFGSPTTGVLTPNLYELDRNTGDTTLVGNLGVELQSLAWDSDLGLIGAFDHLYEIDTVTGSASQVGTNDFTDGIPGMFNGLYSLATVVSDTVFDGDFDMDGDVDGTDFLIWQRDQSVGALSDWESNFGTVISPSLATIPFTVPEPNSLLLVAMVGLAGIACKRSL